MLPDRRALPCLIESVIVIVIVIVAVIVVVPVIVAVHVHGNDTVIVIPPVDSDLRVSIQGRRAEGTGLRRLLAQIVEAI